MYSNKHELPGYEQRFDGNLKPVYILRKMRDLTGLMVNQIIKFYGCGINTIKVWVRDEKGRVDIYLFTYFTGSKWHLRTLDYENEIKEN